MAPSQQEKAKGKVKEEGKETGNYEKWSIEQSHELLQTLIEAAKRGWRDPQSGLIDKKTVLHKILPVFNKKLGCEKTYIHYFNRVKWFKKQYVLYTQLLRHSSGFGWDPILKKITASDEVWDEYFKAHPTHKGLRTQTYVDYEDLKLAVGNGTATGKNSISLGDDTDATTYMVEDSECDALNDLVYNTNVSASIPIGNESSFQAYPPPPPPLSPLSFEERNVDAFHVIHEFMLLRSRRPIDRPLTRRSVTSDGYQYIHKILDDDPKVFRHVCRMFPDVFRKLCTIIREKTLLRDTRHLCIEEMLAIFLLTIGQNNRYSQVILTFRRSHFTCSTSFNKVLKALNTFAPELMVKPEGVQPKIRESTRFYPYFKDCIGALDGTHIPAMVRGPEVSAYRDRYGKISQNVLAASNFDLEFIYVLSGWEGSAHDSRVLSDALTRINGLKVPPGKFFLVDAGFANRRNFLAPYRAVRYHLKEFSGQGRHPENPPELFNLRHASLRNVVERIFGVFKSRFTIFKIAPPFPFKTQAELVLACAGLHNFLRKECRSDIFPPESEPDPILVDDEDDEFQTQDQQREEANDWRNQIAAEMWRDARPQPVPEANSQSVPGANSQFNHDPNSQPNPLLVDEDIRNEQN